ncbi:Transmembrane and coiled-coil domain-containing protein 6 [Saguinus oedipus]|uniref:Transmembrane and coiled-coil domain-containing protein 6 n=1 Tax=Saguinus oedipus TaxID=9490 RepID=A0ABQ9W5C8_SAGOE|nr:Transmembrane and coiled-coil domain-containing protein 6 [Saguinus oedipus]
MWSGRQGRLRPVVCGVEELRRRRREREAVLRKARREQQLVSKRLLRDDAPEEAGEGCVSAILGETEVRGQSGVRWSPRRLALDSRDYLRSAPNLNAMHSTLLFPSEVGIERLRTCFLATMCSPFPCSELQVQQLLRQVQRGTEEKRERALVSLRRGLQHPETQQTFIQLEGSMRTLVGLLTSNQAQLQLEAARCLHELSHSEQSTVAEACLPATSYLLTYLSSHSSDFIPGMKQAKPSAFVACSQELCLYTLGNLIVESEAVRRQLLPQGIVPALAACIQVALACALCLGAESLETLRLSFQSDPYPVYFQSPHVAVLEALGFALSQLLQAQEAPEKIIP